MNPFPTKEELSAALAARCTKQLQGKLQSSVIAVCGLGGLGSNIAVCLARAGIGKLILIDFDRVDISNLHRQQYKASQIGMYKTEALAANLLEISPYLNLTLHPAQIQKENISLLLSDADIICEAFDRAEIKAMLVNGVLEDLPDAYLIAASGMAGLGSGNEIKTKKISDHFYLCGDGKSDVADTPGLLSSRVMLCAAHQAHMALRVLAGQFDC